jgi:hypothetical protein
MRWFLRTVDVLNFQVANKVKAIGIATHDDAIKWQKWMKDAQPIVFEKTGDAPEETKDISCELSLDCPFQTIAIEMADGPICSPPEDYGIDWDVYIYCIVVREVEPKKFESASLVKAVNKMTGDMMFNIVLETKTLNEIVQKLMDRLNSKSSSVGFENIRSHAIKLGSGKSKDSFRVRRIVHVVPKKEQQAYSQRYEKVDWSHRWLVRGHWRKVDGVGKDRAGDYSTNGFTWVTDHEKGPESAPLITKTRLVAEQ